MVKKRRKRKFNNKKVSYDGRQFDSKGEQRRYKRLKEYEKGGDIFDLACQPEFQLIPPFEDEYGKKHRGTKYFADFEYRKASDPDIIVVEDFKGVMTDTFRLKAKLLAWTHPWIDFRIVKKYDEEI